MCLVLLQLLFKDINQYSFGNSEIFLILPKINVLKKATLHDYFINIFYNETNSLPYWFYLYDILMKVDYFNKPSSIK